MYSFTYDAARHVLVVIASDHPKGVVDYEELIRQVDRLDREGAAQNAPVAFMLVIGPRSPSPSAQWRHRFAEQRVAMKAPRVVISVIAPSAIVRGVMTAMNWLKPVPPHIQSANHATFDQGASFIELSHGTPTGILRRMYQEALAGIPRTVAAL